MTTLKELKEELAQIQDEHAKNRKKAEIAALTASADNEIRLAQRNIGYNVREWTVEVIIQKYGDNIENDKNELLFQIINVITSGIQKQPLAL
ncbi:hypothetical protein ACOI37_17660 [Escherichia coli]